jgi:hypothetical protein
VGGAAGWQGPIAHEALEFADGPSVGFRATPGSRVKPRLVLIGFRGRATVVVKAAPKGEGTGADVAVRWTDRCAREVHDGPEVSGEPDHHGRRFVGKLLSRIKCTSRSDGEFSVEGLEAFVTSIACVRSEG